MSPYFFLALAFRVRAAFFAEAERSAGVRFFAAVFVCFESADLEAGFWLSRFKALVVASERLAEGFLVDALLLLPVLRSRSARLRVLAEVLPFAGAASFTPARRAFESPMAIACLVERTPCLPWRT